MGKSETIKTENIYIRGLVLQAVGFEVGVCSLLDWDGRKKIEVERYQIMIDGRSSTDLDEFWVWHTKANKQFFDTAAEAAFNFVEAHRKYKSEQDI